MKLQEQFLFTSSAVLQIEPEDGSLFSGLRVWRLIPRDQDVRPSWRYAFDSGQVDFTLEYQDSRMYETRFGVKLWWRDLENLVQDDWKILIDDGHYLRRPLHEQRLYFFLNVRTETIIQFVHETIGNWFPQVLELICQDIGSLLCTAHVARQVLL